MTAEELVSAVHLWVFHRANHHAQRLRIDPDDLAQETFLRIVRYAHTFDPLKATPTTWAARICDRLASEMARDPRRPLSLDYEDTHFEQSLHDRVAAPVEPDAGLEPAEVVAIRDAVSALPDDLREITGRYYGLPPHEPHTQQAIAEANQVSRAWIALQLATARTLLAKTLAEHAPTAPARRHSAVRLSEGYPH